MNGKQPSLEVKVWSDLACFTRPEMKVERVTYPVMTPSAARGVLEAIFWKPEFWWQVREIHVLKPIRYFSIVRNETNSRQSDRVARKWTRSGEGYFADEDRAQRHTLALYDVAYRIKADIVLKPHAGADVAKYRDQFRRHVTRGQCQYQPYLGCREFSAAFGDPGVSDSPIDVTDELGLMLFDMRYKHDEHGYGVSGEPMFFTAKLDHGVLRVPAEKYQEVI